MIEGPPPTYGHRVPPGVLVPLQGPRPRERPRARAARLASDGGFGPVAFPNTAARPFRHAAATASGASSAVAPDDRSVTNASSRVDSGANSPNAVTPFRRTSRAGSRSALANVACN